MKKEIDKLRDDKNYYGEEGKKYLSNSDIKSLLYTPKQFRVPVKETIEMVLGRYIHQRLLEPDKAVNFPVYEGKIRKGAEYEKFLEENEIKLALKTSDVEQVDEMLDYLTSNIHFYDLVNNGITEEPMIKEIKGYLWKGKADILKTVKTDDGDTDMVIDIKTCADVHRWPISALNYFYDTQAYVYSQLFDRPVMFVVIEKNQKEYYDGEKYWDWATYIPTEETLQKAEAKVVKALTMYEKFFKDQAENDIKNFNYQGTF